MNKTTLSLIAATLASTAMLPIAAQAEGKAEGAGAKVGAKLDDAGRATKDTAITAKLKTKLAADDALSATDIHVTTKNGIVTLDGAVDNQAQIDLAGKVIKESDGVKGVVNQLKLKTS